MKKLIFAALMIFAAATTINAQTKQDAKDFNSRVSALDKTRVKDIEKQAKSEAKRLTKEGWKPMAGGAPIQEQLYQLYIKIAECDMAEEAGKTPKFLFGESQAKGTALNAASKQAKELARVDVAGNISSKTAEIIKNSVSNAQQDAEEMISLAKTVAESKTLIQQNLGRVSNAYEAYREVNGKYEVAIRLQYNSKQLPSTLSSQMADLSAGARAEVEKILTPEE